MTETNSQMFPTSYLSHIFNTIGHWVILKIKSYTTNSYDLFIPEDPWIVGVIFTSICAIFSLILLRLLLGIPKFILKISDNRRVTNVKMELELAQKRNQFSHLTQQFESLTSKMAELEENNSIFLQELEFSQEKCLELGTSLKVLEDENQTQKTEKEESTIILDQKTAKIDENILKIEEKISQNSELTEHLNSRANEIEFLKNQVSRLEEIELKCQRQDVLIENILAQFFVNGTEDDVISLKKIMEDLLSPNELRSNYLLCLKKLNQSEETVFTLKSRFANVEASLSARVEEVDELSRQRCLLESKMTLTNELLTSTMNQIYEEKAEMLVMAREQKKLEAKLGEYESKVSNHSAHLKEYDDLINSVRSARDLMEDRYRSTQLVVGRQEQTINDLRNKINSLECSLSAANTLNESNKPFAQLSSEKDLHPCLLGLLHPSKMHVKPQFSNNLPPGDSYNVADYKFPMDSHKNGHVLQPNERPPNSMSIGSNLSTFCPISSIGSNIPQFGNSLEINLPDRTCPPLMSTVIQDSFQNSFNTPPNIPLTENLRQLPPKYLPGSGNMDKNTLKPPTDGHYVRSVQRKHNLSMTSNSRPDSQISELSQYEDTDPLVNSNYHDRLPMPTVDNGGLISYAFPTLTPSIFFQPESLGECQFDDPFAVLDKHVVDQTLETELCEDRSSMSVSSNQVASNRPRVDSSVASVESFSKAHNLL